jgi:hypothetical protein
MCTFVPLANSLLERIASPYPAACTAGSCQHWYFCTSKASSCQWQIARTSLSLYLLQVTAGRSLTQQAAAVSNLYFCTSKASKVSTFFNVAASTSLIGLGTTLKNEYPSTTNLSTLVPLIILTGYVWPHTPSEVILTCYVWRHKPSDVRHRPTNVSTFVFFLPRRSA